MGGLDERAKDVLFREARTLSRWQERGVSPEILHELYDLLKNGPTAANSCPARFVFLTTPEAKERLRPHLDAGNVDKTMRAPVTVIIAQDLRFYEKMDRLFPHAPGARSWFEGDPEAVRINALRNSSLQGAYLIVAARTLGLDCGPMGGFNADGVKAEFFAGRDVVPNFLCNLGYGDRAEIHPRSPRLGFDEACEIV